MSTFFTRILKTLATKIKFVILNKNTVLGFVVGTIIPAYLYLTTYVQGIDYGDVGEWVGSLATVIALGMVVWQVRRSEYMTQQQLINQSNHEKARRIEDNRPRFKVNIVTFTENKKFDGYVIPDTSDMEKEDISKNLFQYPKSHTFIEIVNLVEPRAMDFKLCIEYQKMESGDFWEIVDNKSVPIKYTVDLGPFLNDKVYIIPPTSYIQKDLYSDSAKKTKCMDLGM